MSQSAKPIGMSYGSTLEGWYYEITLDDGREIRNVAASWREACTAARAKVIELGGADPYSNVQYLPPGVNPACLCEHPGQVMTCPFGHLTECHAEMYCWEAECGHWQAEMKRMGVR